MIAMAKPSAPKAQSKPQQSQSTPVVSSDIPQQKSKTVITQNPQLAALALVL